MSLAPPKPVAQRGRGRRTGCRSIACVVLLLAVAGPAAAQVFQLTGGSSTLFNAHGGSVEFRGQNYAGRVSLGFSDRPRAGFFLAAPYRGYTWGLGDQAISFTLPTDLFNRSYYFLGRGLSASRKDARSALFLYAGATSTGFNVPFLTLAEADTPTSLVFYERDLSPALRFYSRNVFSRRQTSIQGLGWQARKDLRLGLSAGIGNNEHYWSSSLDFARRWLSLQASYARAGDTFHRLQVASPMLDEADRENIRLELAPRSNLRFVLSRHNYLAPPASGAEELRATVNSAGVWTSARGLQLYAALYGSVARNRQSHALSLGARRSLTSRLEAGVDYLRSGLPGSPASSTVVTTVRETLTPRLSLNQVITRGNGQTSMAFGGEFLSNWLTVSVDYQTLFLPFVLAGQSAFRQVLVVSLHFQLPRGFQVNASTQVTPLGQVRYTGYASTFAYRGFGGESAGSPPGSAFYQNAVRGRVRDDEGQPVAGAALLIDGESVFTNSQGLFFVRRRKAQDYRMEVALDRFMVPGRFTVVSAPRTVRAGPEDRAEMYEIVVRRLPSLSRPSLRNALPKPCTDLAQLCGIVHPGFFQNPVSPFLQFGLGQPGAGPTFAWLNPGGGLGHGQQDPQPGNCALNPGSGRCRSFTARAGTDQLPAGGGGAAGADAGNRSGTVAGAPRAVGSAGRWSARRNRGPAKRVAVCAGSERNCRVQADRHASSGSRRREARELWRKFAPEHIRVSPPPGHNAGSAAARLHASARP